MPPCPDSAESETHVHAIHRVKRNPFPELSNLQAKAKKKKKVLVFNAKGEITYLSSANWPRMTTKALEGRFLGSSIPKGALLPPRLWEREFEYQNSWPFCPCIKLLDKDAPVEGARIRVVQSRPEKGSKWHITCHLRDYSNLQRPTCEFFADLQDIFKALGGSDPDDPLAPDVTDAPATHQDVPETALITPPEYSDDEGEVIPPSDPVTPTPSPVKASRHAASRPSEDIRYARAPRSTPSSVGSIIPSSVQSNNSSPFIVIPSRREPSILILSSDESDGEGGHGKTNIRSGQNPLFVSSASRHRTDASGSIDDGPTPKAQRRKEKGKFKAAEPVIKQEDEEESQLDKDQETELVHEMNALLQRPGQFPFAYTNAGQALPGVPLSSRPLTVDTSALPQVYSQHALSQHVLVDARNQLYYVPPGDISPTKKRSRPHTNSVSSTTSGGPPGPQRPRIGSISTPGVPSIQPTAAPMSTVNSPGAFYIGNASHSATCQGHFPYGLTTPTSSSMDPFAQGYTPGRYFGPQDPTPPPPTPQSSRIPDDVALPFLLHITTLFPNFIQTWNTLHTPAGGMHVDLFLAVCGLRMCHTCFWVCTAGELEHHRIHDCSGGLHQYTTPRDPGVSRRR